MQKTSYTQAVEQLKSQGLRLTPQRQIILQHLKGTDEHPTADQVHRVIGEQFPGISLATVYNSLKFLMEAGVIGEVVYGHDSSRYDGNDSPHAHLVCVACGSLHDIPLPPQQAVTTPDVLIAGFETKSMRVEFHGLCAACKPIDAISADAELRGAGV